jgi:hypothetical protein
MSLYRKKPVVIEAVQFDGTYATADAAMALNPIAISCTESLPMKLSISTLEGTMIANPGDYVIRGVKGEVYPCKPDIFAATYEPAQP